jgi:hypothetical protein
LCVGPELSRCVYNFYGLDSKLLSKVQIDSKRVLGAIGGSSPPPPSEPIIINLAQQRLLLDPPCSVASF